MIEPDTMVTPPGAGFDRQPPFSSVAEVSVLGGMLMEPTAVDKATELVQDHMFFREAHRRLFRAMVRLSERGDVIDPITLSEELKNTGELDAAGGLPYLAELLDAVPTAANIEYHAKIVREKALLRNLIDAASTIIREVYDQGERSVEEVTSLSGVQIAPDTSAPTPTISPTPTLRSPPVPGLEPTMRPAIPSCATMWR